MLTVKQVAVFATAVTMLLGMAAPAFANGIGEGRSFQFRTDNQRQVLLGAERLRLEHMGLLGSGTGLGGTGCGQNGNTTSVSVINSPGAMIVVDQVFTGNQSVGGGFEC